MNCRDHCQDVNWSALFGFEFAASREMAPPLTGSIRTDILAPNEIR